MYIPNVGGGIESGHYRTGDIANGHILTADGTWQPYTFTHKNSRTSGVKTTLIVIGSIVALLCAILAGGLLWGASYVIGQINLLHDSTTSGPATGTVPEAPRGTPQYTLQQSLRNTSDVLESASGKKVTVVWATPEKLVFSGPVGYPPSATLNIAPNLTVFSKTATRNMYRKGDTVVGEWCVEGTVNDETYHVTPSSRGWAYEGYCPHD